MAETRDGVADAALYEKVSACRSCGCERLSLVLDVGQHPLPDFGQRWSDSSDGRAITIPGKATPTPEWRWAPLQLMECEDCTLLQLAHTVDRDAVFRNYWYTSSINQTMRDHLAQLSRDARNTAGFETGDTAIDIGCNDGELLESFQAIEAVGFEPSSEHARIAQEKGHVVSPNFFTAAQVLRPPAKLIFTIAMFYSVPDPNQFVADIKKVLAPDGVWVCEMNTIENFAATGDYGFIGHEHVALYSVHSFERLLERHDLHISKISFHDINGGSTRFSIKHGSASTTWASTVSVPRIANNVKRHAGKLNATLRAIWADGKTIHALGASTRGVTMVHYAGLHSFIQVVSDRNPRKHGFCFPGTTIPIVSEESSREMKPDYYLILPWGFSDEIMAREREAGFDGKFILPFPEVAIR